MVSESTSPSQQGAQVRTFLIADVRGYTRFTVEHGDEAALRLAARFAGVCREIVAARDGEVIELRGDEALAVFSSTRAALWAATDLQARLAQESLADPALPLQVGIGVDAGEAIPFENGYRGAALNLAARLCSLASAGEILVSETVTHLARRVEGLEYADRGMVTLKGFADEVRVLEVRPAERLAESYAIDESDAGPGPSESAPHALPIGGFLGALPAGPLVAREDDVQRALAPIEAAARGEGRLVLLAGEPGVGKTRLAQEVTLHLRDRDFVIVAGSCFEARQTVPYYPFLDVIAMLYGAAPPSLRSEVPQRWSALAHLLPEAGIPHTAGANEQEEQQRLFRAITGFVEALAESRPVAILFDDLHWADRSSLDLLQHLARHTRARRVFLLGTYRDVEVGRQHPLEETLLELSRQGLVERIPVRRLDEAGTAALIAATFEETEISDEFAQIVYGNTEGNPFFTGEVLRALVERGDIYRENGRWERRTIGELQVPESVRAAIGQRLSRLSDAAQETLREASVLGQRFHFDELQVMADRDEAEVESALEEAVTAGLVRDAGKDVYAFSHALTQQALYAELSPRRRRRLHLAAGDALEALPERKRTGRVAELAWHFLQADDDRALPYALRAGDAAEAVFAHDEAEAQYRTALELAEEPGDTASEAEALEMLAAIAIGAARYEEAASLAERAANAYRAVADVEGERRAVARLGKAYAELGRVDEGLAQVQSLMNGIDDEPVTPGLVDLSSAESVLLFISFRLREHAEAARRNLELAQTLGDERRLADVSGRYAESLHVMGRIRDSLPAFEEARALIEKQGPSRHLVVLLHNMGDVFRMAGDVRRGLACQEQGLEVAEQIDNPGLVGFAEGWLGHLHTILGSWDAARRHCERGVAIFEEIGHSWSSVYPLLFLGSLDEMEGRATADERLRQAWTMAMPRGDAQAMSEALPALVRRSFFMDRPEAGLQLVQEMVAGCDEQVLSIWGAIHTAYIAWVRLELGEIDEAEHLIRESLGSPVMGEDTHERVVALRILGLVRTRTARHDEARSTFDEALSLARSMPWPFEEASILHEYGVMLGQAGETEAGRRHLTESLAIFQDLGALPYIARTEQALADLVMSD